MTWREEILIGYDDQLYNDFGYGDSPIFWDYEKYPHMLICGPTGSGKTCALKNALTHIGWTAPDVRLWLCDFKNDDFKFAEGEPRYYGFKACADGLNEFYKVFEARQSGADTSRGFRALVFDEWGAYLSTLDKKLAEAEKAKLSALLMLGRSFNVHVIISQQRADAEYFAKARDNFGAILGMGELSKEAKEMLFSEVKEDMYPAETPGIGYFLQGAKLYRIWVPLSEVKDMNASILPLVSR